MRDLAEQRALNQVLIQVLADISGRDFNQLTKEIDRVSGERFQKIYEAIFRVYGLVDLEDLMADNLDS